MELGKEIKQQVFKNEYQKLMINILYTSNYLSSKNLAKLKPYRITPEQFNVLRILRGQYPKAATINLIIERMLDKNSNASRLVEKLRLKKLLERATCPEDRRAVNVIISKQGLKLLEKLDVEENSWTKELMHLSEAEARQINNLLDKIRI